MPSTCGDEALLYASVYKHWTPPGSAAGTVQSSGRRTSSSSTRDGAVAPVWRDEERRRISAGIVNGCRAQRAGAVSRSGRRRPAAAAPSAAAIRPLRTPGEDEEEPRESSVYELCSDDRTRDHARAPLPCAIAYRTASVTPAPTPGFNNRRGNDSSGCAPYTRWKEGWRRHGSLFAPGVRCLVSQNF